jgi:hypothetical protein
VSLIVTPQNQVITDKEPLGHPIIVDLIKSQFFGKGKADMQTFNKLVKMKKIPESMIILVITTVRPLLKLTIV